MAEAERGGAGKGDEAGRGETAGADRRVGALMALMALWLAAYGYSVLLLLGLVAGGATEPLPEARRSAGFLGWQGIAGMLAFGCWGLGRGFAPGRGIRRVAAVPLLLALALAVVLLLMALFGPDAPGAG